MNETTAGSSIARTEGRQPAGTRNDPIEIDEVNAGIIEILQENGRASFRQIAGRLGVSEATIRARYARLLEADVLHVTAVTDPLRLGFDVMAIVGVRASGAAMPLAQELAAWPEVSYVVLTAGRFDLLIEVVCADRAAFLDLSNRVRLLPGAQSTESFMYLGLEKQKYNWGAKVVVPSSDAEGTG